jgi:hypothetical protein
MPRKGYRCADADGLALADPAAGAAVVLCFAQPTGTRRTSATSAVRRTADLDFTTSLIPAARWPISRLSRV